MALTQDTQPMQPNDQPVETPKAGDHIEVVAPSGNNLYACVQQVRSEAELLVDVWCWELQVDVPAIARLNPQGQWQVRLSHKQKEAIANAMP